MVSAAADAHPASEGFALSKCDVQDTDCAQQEIYAAGTTSSLVPPTLLTLAASIMASQAGMMQDIFAYLLTIHVQQTDTYDA